MRGTIKWYDPAKGYGFIKGASSDIFLHRVELEKIGLDSIDSGEMVEFERVVSSRRPGKFEATRLRLIGRPVPGRPAGAAPIRFGPGYFDDR
jgi:CspA family cold shock protein